MAAPLKTRPYEGPGDADLPDSVKRLPSKAKEIWVAAYNSAWDAYDPETAQQDSREGYANAVAWGAVNKKYRQKKDGTWVARAFVLASYEAPFTHVKRTKEGRVLWATTCSDDGVDRYATRMTIDLHEDFLRNAKTRGMPYLTIAHFNQLARIGEATELWRDGRRLKASGHFYDERDTDDHLILDLAKVAADAALDDMNRPPRERRIRTSIGFKPLRAGVQTEDLGVLAYVRGWLPEITMTTHPGNSRVDFSSERSGDMKFRISPEFMEADAATIVGEGLAKKLRERLETVAGRSGDEDDPIELIYRSGDFEERASVPSHKGRAKEDGKWDGDAATKRARKHASKGGSGEAEDMSWPKYRSFHAVYDPENAETFGAYGFIHHDTDDQGMFVDMRGVIAAGTMARGARAGKENPDAQKHLGPHYKQFDRTPPWERSAERLVDRLEDIDDALVLELQDDVVNGLKARLAVDIAEGRMTDFAGIEMVEGDGLILRTIDGETETRFDDIILPLVEEGDTVERVGRRLQGKRLDQLAAIGNQLSEAASGISDLVEWARANEKGEGDERSIEDLVKRAVQEGVAATAAFSEHMKERLGDVEADDSLIETMEHHSMMQVAFEAAMTLTDIVVANMAPDLEAKLEERMQNVEKALGEYGQVIGSMLVSAFGGGRSAAPKNESDEPESDPENVNRAGDGTGTVNAGNGSEGQPDLAGLDASSSKLRQLVLDQAPVEEIQAALQEEVAQIEAALGERPADQSQADESLVERLSLLEASMSQLQEGVHELLERSDQPQETERRPERPAWVPRRRSLPPGPPPAEAPKAQPRQVGLNRQGQAKRLTIGQAVEQSMGPPEPLY
jgi:cation transport regulator